jgi:hypothetical protein
MQTKRPDYFIEVIRDGNSLRALSPAPGNILNYLLSVNPKFNIETVAIFKIYLKIKLNNA